MADGPVPAASGNDALALHNRALERGRGRPTRTLVGRLRAAVRHLALQAGRLLPAALLALTLGYTASAAASDPALRGFPAGLEPLAPFIGQGQWVVVMFWASDCHICNDEAPALNAFHRRHAGEDAMLLGIAMDGARGEAAARAFMTRHALAFDSLLAEPEAAAALYRRETGRRWIGTPSFLVYTPGGVLAAQQVGAVEPELIESFMASYRPPADRTAGKD